MKRLIALCIPILLASKILAQVTIVASVDKNPVRCWREDSAQIHSN
jgi:hypothetical protein